MMSPFWRSFFFAYKFRYYLGRERYSINTPKSVEVVLNKIGKDTMEGNPSFRMIDWEEVILRYNWGWTETARRQLVLGEGSRLGVEPCMH